MPVVRSRRRWGRVLELVRQGGAGFCDLDAI